MLRRERERKSHRVRAVVLTLLAGVILGIWHNRRVALGKTDFVTGSVRIVTTPVVSALNGITGWIGGQIGWMFRGRSVAEENKQLKEENARLMLDNAALKQADASLKRLREQLSFKSNNPAIRIGADVIAVRTFSAVETIVVSRGTMDGLAPHNVVIAPKGLVGQVTDVSPTSSVVQLITDGPAAVGAMVQRPESRAIGVCKSVGRGRNQLELVYLDDTADVKTGDIIVTSGMGGELGVFPKGIPIGMVDNISGAGSSGSRKVLVKPFVDFNHLEEVYILK